MWQVVITWNSTTLERKKKRRNNWADVIATYWIPFFLNAGGIISSLRCDQFTHAVIVIVSQHHLILETLFKWCIDEESNTLRQGDDRNVWFWGPEGNWEMSFPVLSILKRARSYCKAGQQPDTYTWRHLLDSFSHINCQTCLDGAGSEATFQGESLTSVSYQTLYLLLFTCAPGGSFAFQFQRRAGWAAFFSFLAFP